MKKFILVIMSICVMFPISSNALTEKEEINVDEIKEQIVTLESCIDGDTAKFKLDTDEVIKARFLAVDTPETVHPTKGEEPFGKDASNYTCNTLVNAQEIKLEYDKNSQEEDKYGRKLVWVFVDGVLLQDLLVSQGYAEVAYLYDDYKYTSLLQDSETIAKVNKLGIWSSEEEKEDTQQEESEKKEKGFFEKLIDDLLGMIYNFINDLLEKILKMIEDML